MLLLQLYSLVLAASGPSLGATAPAVHTRAAVADSEPVLTANVLTRMTKFWTAFSREPDSIKTTANAANQDTITVTMPSQRIQMQQQITMVKMTAMAAKYPSVAADLKKVGLTAQQWEAYRLALYNAVLTKDAVDPPPPTPGSALEKNVTFLKAHSKELTALTKAGMPIPTPPSADLLQRLDSMGRRMTDSLVRSKLGNPGGSQDEP